MKAVVVLALLLLLVAVPVSAHECGCDFQSGQEFGEHVSMMAQEGHIGAEHNPGHHQGYSPWAP